jgi:hypothetical protein
LTFNRAKLFRSLLIFGFVATMSLGSTGSQSEPIHPLTDPISLYGPTLEFEVLWGDKLIGHHKITFQKDRDGFQVVATTEMSIKVLFATVFRLEQKSEAFWVDGSLREMKATTTMNGKETNFEVQRDGDDFRIAKEDEILLSEGPLFPSTHWNMSILSSTRILNTLTGEVGEVDVVDLGEVNIETVRGTILARHFIYSGDLDAEVWYDEDGRWISYKLSGRGGTVEYRCLICGL